MEINEINEILFFADDSWGKIIDNYLTFPSLLGLTASCNWWNVPMCPDRSNGSRWLMDMWWSLPLFHPAPVPGTAKRQALCRCPQACPVFCSPGRGETVAATMWQAGRIFRNGFWDSSLQMGLSENVGLIFPMK